jgi:DNA-binding transcriptional ArsR family regulator
MARRKDSITLEDPRALRALAHPARQRLINELFAGRVRTATEAADLVGLSPSAVSHHLRALEKWGLARRAASTGDGRERPWEGTARTLNLRPRPEPASQAAMSTVVAMMMDEFGAEVNQFMANLDKEEWRGRYQGISRGELWLTADETKELSLLIQDAAKKYERRTHGRHPKDSRRTSFTWSLIPLEPAPPGRTPETG